MNLSIICALFVHSFVFGQTSGFIYKQSTSALGRSVLDPNGDGFTSTTSSGFSSTDYGVNSELNMIPLPIMINEPVNDLATGSNGGHTDIVSASNGQSCYILKRTVNGVDYIIIRFRLGGSSTATKGYSILFDLDGNINNNYSAKNPGFEREMVLETGNRVSIYTHSAGGGINLDYSYNIDDYSQRSVALSTVSSNPDYFYDYFVPMASLNAANPIRIMAATVTSAQSGITGTISDVNGVNDAAYGGSITTIMQTVIGGFPSFSLSNVNESYTFPQAATSAPVITSALNTSSTSISGTSQEADGTVITIYKNGTSIGTATVTANSWTLNGVSGLLAGNLITAKAQATGKTLSSVSNTVEVTTVQLCYTPAPVITTRTNGSQVISGTWAPVSGTISANTIQIRLYQQTGVNTFSEVTSATAQYVGTNGSWTFTTNVTQNTFNGYTVFATATNTATGCVSGYSGVSFKTSGNSGTKTVAPTITTSTILASPTIARTVSVTNNDATASYLYLYVNGTLVASSPSTVAANGSYSFSYTGFNEGDLVTARAQSATASYWLSDVSNTVTVTIPVVQTTAPVISGTYFSGSNKTVYGTSSEIAGTVIYLYKAGTTLIGTTTVSAYGTWSISGLTLASADVLTATAKASGKTLSATSNAVTVQASQPTAPSVTGPLYAGGTSISGTGGSGTVTVYIDGSPIGTTTGTNWTLSGISSVQLYRGAVVTATNTVSSIESVLSNSVVVQGVVSFCITDLNGNPLTSKISEEQFGVKIVAMSGPNCTGSVYTNFNNTVTIGSPNSLLSGGGVSGTFVNGVLTTTLAIGGSGSSVGISAVNTNDPTAYGSASIQVIAPSAVVSNAQNICSSNLPNNLSLSTNLPTVFKWQKSSTADFSSPVDITNSTTSLTGASIGYLNSNTYFRAVLKTGSNNIVNSNVILINVDLATQSGNIQGGGNYCQGSNVNLSLTGHVGSVVNWQKSTVSDFSSNVTTLDNVTASNNLSNVSTTEYYRANVKSGVCDASVSPIISINVSPTPLGGKIFGAVVCQGYNRTMPLTDYSGQIIKWQSSTSEDFTANLQDINTTASSYTVTNLQQTTYFRVQVGSGVCPTVYSVAGMIVATPVSNGGSLTGANSVCTGTNSSQLNVANYVGSITKWQSSPYSTFASTVVDITNTNPSLTVSNATSSLYYRAVVKNGICPIATSNPVLINVSTPSVGGTVNGSTSVCAGNNSVALTLTGQNGSVQSWQSSNTADFSGTITPITNTTSTLTVNNLSTTTYYRAVVVSGACDLAYSSVATITVSPGTAGGTVTGNSPVCSGANTVNLSLTGLDGSVSKWQRSTTSDFSTGITNITSTATSISLSNLTATTYVRAEIQKSGCTSSLSSVYTITVNPSPTGGTISGFGTICTGLNKTLTLSGNTGTISKWQSSTTSDFSSAITDIANTTNSLTTPNLTATTYFRAVSTNGSCSSNSSIAAVSVVANSQGGTINGSSSVCEGTNSTTLTLVNSLGTIQKWQKSTSSTFSSNVTDIVNTTNSLTVTDPTTTTYYRAVVKNSVCNSALSSNGTVTVNTNTIAGTLSGATTVCAGNNTATLSLSGNNGSPISWQSSVSGDFGADVVNINSISSPYSPTNLATSTYFRAIVANGACLSQITNSVLVTVLNATSGGTIAGASSSCSGGNVSLTLSGYEGTVSRWQRSTTSDFSTGVTNITSTSNTYLVTGITAVTYIRAEVINSVCGNALSNTFTINVGSTPTGGTVAGSGTICANYNKTLTLSGNTAPVIKWQSSTASDFSVNLTDIVNTTTTLTATSVPVTTYYRAVVSNGTCNANSSTGTLLIVSSSNGGVVNGGIALCEGPNSTLLTVSGYNGTITKWQKSSVSTFLANVTDIATTADNITATDLTTTTYYRAIVKNGICPTANSSVATISISSPSIGGTLSAGTTVCAGINSSSLSLTGQRGTVSYWQGSSNSSFTADVYNINSTATTLPINNLNSTTYFRAVVANGGCAPAYSTTSVITVNSGSQGGTLSGSSTVCEGPNTSTFTVSGITGNITGWQTSSTSDFSSNVFPIASTETSLTLNNLAATTYVRVIVTKTGCSAAYSSIGSTIIKTTPLPSTLQGANVVCPNLNTSTLTLTGYDGAITWQFSADGTTYTDVSNTSNSPNYTATNLTADTYFRAVVNDGICPSVNSNSVTVSMMPQLSNVSVIAGPTNVLGMNTATFSVSPVTNAIKYEWLLPFGMSMQSTTGGNVINVSLLDSYLNGIITVKAIGQCSESDTKWVAVIRANVPAQVQMSGPTQICVSSPITQTYSIEAVAGATNYRWSLPSGATLSPNATATNSISIDFGTDFTTGNLTVNAENASGIVIATSTVLLESYEKTAIPSGPINLCGLTTATYTVPAVTGATSYNWIVPGGMSITNGSSTNSITVSIGSGVVTGYVKAQSVGTCGASSYTSLAVSKILTPGTIIGEDVTCGVTLNTASINSQFTTITPQYLNYKVYSIAGADTYTWNVPTGASIISGQGTESIWVLFSNTFNSGSVSLVASNSVNGCSSISRSKAVYASNAQISGPSSLCGLTSATYSVPADAGATFNWTIPSWMTITAGSLTSNSITVSFTQPLCQSGTVTVQVNSLCGGGNTLSIAASCLEYTKIQDGQNNSIVNSNALIIANSISGATGYRFRVTGTNFGYVLEKTTNSFTFSEIPGFSYGVQYTVEVAYKTALADYGSYGCTVSISLRNTKIQSTQCGISNVALTTLIYADAVSGATAYKFEISGYGVNNSNPAAIGTYEIITPNRYFSFNQVPGVSFGSTYSIRASVKNPDNVTYSDYSDACQVTIQTTKLQSTQCGVTGLTANTAIYANALSGATSYKFEITGVGLDVANPDNVGVFVYETTNRFFYFSSVPGFVFGLDYSVKVAAKNPDNTTYGAYGDACSIGIKTTQIQASQSNIVDVVANTLVYADALNSATGYKFEISGPGLSSPFTIATANRYFTFSQVTGISFGETYSVRVAAKSVSGNYGPYGSSTNLTLKTTQVQATQCGNTTAITSGTLVYADALNSCTGYRFEISAQDGTVLGTLDKTTTARSFKFSEITSITTTGTYNVRVAAKNPNNSTYGRYGSSCPVLVSYATAIIINNEPNSEENNASKDQGEESELVTETYSYNDDSPAVQVSKEAFGDWSISIIENPFKQNFGIKFEKITEGPIEIKIFDLNGKVIESTIDDVNLVSTNRFGQNLNAGVYLVEVMFKNERKQIRVIKQ